MEQDVGGWRPIAEVPRDGRWVVLLPSAGLGFAGEPYPPTVARFRGPYADIDTGEPTDWSIDCKAMNSGSTMFKEQDFRGWIPLPDPPSIL